MSTGMMVALAIAGISVVGIWMLSRRVPHVVDDDWAPPDDEDVAPADPLDEEMRDAGVMGRIRANELRAEQRQPSPLPWTPEPPAPPRTAAEEVTGETAGDAGYVIDVAEAGAQPGIVFLATPTGHPIPEPAAQSIVQPIVQHLPTPQPPAPWEPPPVAPEPEAVPQPIAEPEPEPQINAGSAATQIPMSMPAPMHEPPVDAAPPQPPARAPAAPPRPAPEPVPAGIQDTTPAPVGAPERVSTSAPVAVANVSAPPVSSPEAASPPRTPVPAAPVPPATAVAARPAPAAKPAGPALRFAGVIRGDSSRHGDGRERRYVTLKKKEAVGFPWREGGRVPVDLEVNGKVYSAGVRATRSQPVVYIAADLRGPTGESVTLAAVLEAAGMEKRQPVTIEVENGTSLRLLPGAVPAAGSGKARK